MPMRNGDAWRLAIRIFNALNADHNRPKLLVSLGCATYPVDGQSVESLVVDADKALYEMKNGRQLRFFVSEHSQPSRPPRIGEVSSSGCDGWASRNQNYAVAGL
jgi:GGDEF domain-containing protein